MNTTLVQYLEICHTKMKKTEFRTTEGLGLHRLPNLKLLKVVLNIKGWPFLEGNSSQGWMKYRDRPAKGVCKESLKKGASYAMKKLSQSGGHNQKPAKASLKSPGLHSAQPHSQHQATLICPQK